MNNTLITRIETQLNEANNLLLELKKENEFLKEQNLDLKNQIILLEKMILELKKPKKVATKKEKSLNEKTLKQDLDLLNMVVEKNPIRPAISYLKNIEGKMLGTNIDISILIDNKNNINNGLYEIGLLKKDIFENKLERYQDEYPEIIERNEKEFKYNDYLKIKSSYLLQAIEKTIFSVNKDSSNISTSCIRYQLLEGYLTTVATDTFRLVKYTIPCEYSKADNLSVPTEVNKILLKDLKGLDCDVEFFIDYSRHQVKCIYLNRTIYFRIYDMPFPDFNRIFDNKYFDKNVILDRKLLIETLEKALLISSKNQEAKAASKYYFSNKELKIVSENKENSIEQFLFIDSNFELNIILNDKFLLDYLKTLDTKEVKFEFSNNRAATFINDNYITMPLAWREI